MRFCCNATKRLQLRLMQFDERQVAQWHPYSQAEEDIALNKELQILLRQVYDTSTATIDKLQLKK